MEPFDLETEVRALAQETLDADVYTKLTAHYEIDMQYATTPRQKVDTNITYLKTLLDLIDLRLQSKAYPGDSVLGALYHMASLPPAPPENPGYYIPGKNNE